MYVCASLYARKRRSRAERGATWLPHFVYLLPHAPDLVVTLPPVVIPIRPPRHILCCAYSITLYRCHKGDRTRAVRAWTFR